MTSRRAFGIVAVAAAGLLLLASCAKPTILTPVASDAGTHGHAFDAAVQDLDAAGYAENEYQLSGSANTYSPQGTWTSDGRWGAVSNNDNVPFTTRLLARYPKDRSKFNGTVIVEWLNVTATVDVDVDWPQSYEQYVRDGFAWVGVSAQTIGINSLKSWDPERYGTLQEDSDDLSWDIFSKAGTAVRERSRAILGGLPVDRVLATGQSQSALRLVTYTNAIQPLANVYDGFMIHSRSNGAVGLSGTESPPNPAGIRTDTKVPVFQLQSETDVAPPMGYTLNQPDNPMLRTWEVAGSAHLDAYMLVGSTLPQFQRDLPDSPITNVKCKAMSFTPWLGEPTVNTMPFHYVENAAWRALNRWVRNGIQPVPSKYISVVNGVVERDADGNAKGGIRLPDLEVPLAVYGPMGTGTGLDLISYFFCSLFGTSTPFTAQQLAQRYPSYADYVAAYTASADRNVAAGYMLPVDRDIAVAAANQSWEAVWRTSAGIK